MLFTDQIPADRGVPLNITYPEDCLAIRPEGGAALEWTKGPSWDVTEACIEQLDVWVPATPLQVGALYEIVCGDTDGGWSVLETFTATAPVGEGLPTVTVDYSRRKHACVSGTGCGYYSCGFEGIDDVVREYSAHVAVSVEDAVEPLVVIIRSDDSGDPGTITWRLLAQGRTEVWAPLPLPDPRACVTVEVWNTLGELLETIERCQPDECAYSSNADWYDWGQPALTPLEPTSCALPEDVGVGCTNMDETSAGPGRSDNTGCTSGPRVEPSTPFVLGLAVLWLIALARRRQSLSFLCGPTRG